LASEPPVDPRPRRRPLALVAGIAVAALVGAAIGFAATRGESHTPAELALQRSQLALLSHQLLTLETYVRREAAASRKAWHVLAKGMPRRPTASLAMQASAASAAASAISIPTLVEARHQLIGPAERIASLFHDFVLLSQGGWSHVVQTAASLRNGRKRSAEFERVNAGLYIESIYDGNFDASLIGGHVLDSYERLGAQHAFGRSLTPAEVSSIATAYSPQAELLTPHLWRNLLTQG
jgi:hypothetical protein